jgi:hypothetical protein
MTQKVVKFISEHAEELIERGRKDFGVLADADVSMRPYFDVVAAQDGNAYSIIKDGHLVLSAGVWELWSGVGEAWLLPSAQLLARPRGPVRIVRQYLDDIALKEGFERVQATTHADFKRGHRWLTWLGFELEGVLRKFGPDGSDHNIYSRIKKCHK